MDSGPSAEQTARPHGYQVAAWAPVAEENQPGSLAGRAMFDSTVWQVPYPVAEICVTGQNQVPLPNHENMTRWSPEGGLYPVGGVDTRSVAYFGHASFFASDPMRYGPPWQTNWDHMALGGTVMQGHQTFWAPFQQKPSVDFFPSTEYNPYPSWGSVQRKVL
jgi:hypothetical protein